MSLDLHTKCQAQLRASLANQLVHASVHYGKFLTPSSSAHLSQSEMVLPTNGPVHQRMLKFIGESPLVDFVTGTLARELFETQEFQGEKGPVSLNSLPRYADLPALADRLATEFNSLPWKYTITTPLPVAFSEIFCPNFRNLKLSETIVISRGDDAFANAFPMESGVEKRDQAIAGGGLMPSLLIKKKPAWNPNRAYLQVSVEGFIGKFTNTEPLIDAIGVLRAFYGLGLALYLFKPSPAYQAHPQREIFYIHRQVEAVWIIEDLQELESRHSEIVRDLKLHDLDGKLNTEALRLEWMKQQLAMMSSTFQAADRARNILLGAQWLLDSHCGSDELLQFVQAAVVVEILLGDKASSDLTGLGELLSNRCAYLIATSHAQRNELMSDFRKIYDVRSKIVHRGKSRLMQDEGKLFNQLRWMCCRIITEEIKLLQNG